MEEPAAAALLSLFTDDPGAEPSTAPKLNCGTFENLLGFFDSFAVVLANEAPVPNKMFRTSDEIGPVILHAACPRCPRWQSATPKGPYSGQPPNIRGTAGY